MFNWLYRLVGYVKSTETVGLAPTFIIRLYDNERMSDDVVYNLAVRFYIIIMTWFVM